MIWNVVVPQRLALVQKVRRGERGTHHVVGERRELLNAADRDVRDAALLARLQQSKVHLACAQDMALNVLRRSERGRVRLRYVALKLRLADHLFEV